MNDTGQNTESPAKRPVRFLTRCIATGFFSGYLPWASGTFGTLLGLLLVLLPGAHETTVLATMIVGGFAAGVFTSGRVAAAEGDRLTPTAAAAKAVFQPSPRSHPDPSIVVIDEMVGMWISLLLIKPSVLSFTSAFIAFRVFDVLKPQPAGWLERLPGGWGIMLDDVVAGIYANVAVRVILFVTAITLGTAYLP
jgi:phosphatidylglycerophosphatase A